MTSTVWSRKEIESPCVQICVVHPQSRLCLGCFRSMDEIRDWSSMTDEQRRHIMSELPNREKLAKPKRRGGRARTKT